MTIRLQGKSYRKGIGKTSGRPYEFIEIHYLGTRRGVEGLAAITKTVDPSVIAYDSIEVGAEYSIEYDENGNATTMHKVGAKVQQGTPNTQQK